MLKKDRIITLIISVSLTTALTSLVIRGTERTSDLTASLTQPTEGRSAPCPQDMVFVDSENGGFCVDKYENSPGPGCPYQDSQNETESQINLDSPNCLPVSKEISTPWRNVSQSQAALACARAGKRLPSSKEWYQAALDTPDKDSNWNEQDCQVKSNWPSQPGLTGSGKDCVSSAGAYDMIGNVWEWVDGTIFDGQHEGHPLPEQGFVQGVDDEGLAYQTDLQEPAPNYNQDYFWIKQQGTRGIARGGYWGNGSDAGVYSAYLVVPPSFSGTGVGFRCVKAKQ